MKSQPRYYAQHAELTSTLYLGSEEAGADTFTGLIRLAGWQVFDRQRLTVQGQAAALCLCINRRMAFQIRDALNGEPT